jgi:hypothetical protein
LLYQWAVECGLKKLFGRFRQRQVEKLCLFQHRQKFIRHVHHPRLNELSIFVYLVCFLGRQGSNYFDALNL